MLEKHLSTKQVCKLLRISLSTFYRYCKAILTVTSARISSPYQQQDLFTQEQKLTSFSKNLPDFN